MKRTSIFLTLKLQVALDNKRLLAVFMVDNNYYSFFPFLQWDISLRRDKLFARYNLVSFDKVPWHDFHEFDPVFRTLGEPLVSLTL